MDIYFASTISLCGESLSLYIHYYCPIAIVFQLYCPFAIETFHVSKRVSTSFAGYIHVYISLVEYHSAAKVYLCTSISIVGSCHNRSPDAFGLF